jgi:hypothetical protein
MWKPEHRRAAERRGLRYPSDLTDAEWALVEPMIPPAKRGGHVARCEKCAHTVIAYHSCRNRHCPKCQGAAAKHWLAERQAELLPVPYFHVVFTLPGPIADIAYQNKAVIYDLLFKAAADTMLTIAADPKHLGARIGITAVLTPLRKAEWVVYAKKPFGGPQAGLVPTFLLG